MSSLGSSPLDRQIKGMLVADMFHLVGLYPHDPALISRGGGATADPSAAAGTPRGAAVAGQTSPRSAAGAVRRKNSHRGTGGGGSEPADIDFVNPFAFGALSRMMAQQDAWRKCPHPRSIDMQQLAAANAERATRDGEDDKDREDSSGSAAAALGVFTLLLTIEDELQR